MFRRLSDLFFFIRYLGLISGIRYFFGIAQEGIDYFDSDLI